MKIYLILFLSTIILFTFIGCSPTTITIKEDDQKEKYSVRKNDLIKIILKANPSTGYQWSIENMDTSRVIIIDETYTTENIEREIVGGGGDKIYLFKAINRGSTAIDIEYFRPFEKELQPIKKIHINLEIR